MKKRILSTLLVATTVFTMALTGCGSKGGNEQVVNEDGVKEFSMFIAEPATVERTDDNEVKELIAEKTGVKIKETFLTGQTAQEAIGTIIAGGDYPDMINGGDAMKQLYEAGALIPLDDYIDKYQNIKDFFTEQEWDKFRQDDGHIYWINVFQNIRGEDKTTTLNGEAFWIQARVLEWANYPKIETMDDYFDLIERYNEANPETHDGTKNIPYTILCDDWRYFCLENAPQFLDGYPNDGSVIVDPKTEKVIDYNTTDTAKKYFQKLNEEYKKGIVDPESFTQTYDEYIAKLSTGRVLGMVDQWWDFAFTINDVFKQQDIEQYGYNYIPCPLTIKKGMENQWYTSGGEKNVSNGVAITTSCADPDAVMKFMNDLLEQDMHDLRFWGVEGVDYEVDENGLYYRTDEERKNAADSNYKSKHLCDYAQLPQYMGTSQDGINANMPTEQTSEFMETVPDSVKKVFDAYGVTTYPELMHSVNKVGVWFPMYSFSNNLTTSTAGGTAWTKMGEVKHEWLPKVVMSESFDQGWEDYMQAYSQCKPEDFLSEMQTELDRRIEAEK